MYDQGYAGDQRPADQYYGYGMPVAAQQVAVGGAPTDPFAPQQFFPAGPPRRTNRTGLILGAFALVATIGAGTVYATWPSEEERREQVAFNELRADVPALRDSSDDKLRTMMETSCVVMRNDGVFGLMDLITEYNLGPSDVGAVAGHAMTVYCPEAKDDLTAFGD